MPYPLLPLDLQRNKVPKTEFPRSSLCSSVPICAQCFEHWDGPTKDQYVQRSAAGASAHFAGRPKQVMPQATKQLLRAKALRMPQKSE